MNRLLAGLDKFHWKPFSNLKPFPGKHFYLSETVSRVYVYKSETVSRGAFY